MIAYIHVLDEKPMASPLTYGGISDDAYYQAGVYRRDPHPQGC